MKANLPAILAIAVLPFLKVYSQAPPPEPIIDSGAKYCCNVAYNTGEVYVIFPIGGTQYVSKENPEAIAEAEPENNSGISFYPNPVRNTLTFVTSGKQSVSKVTIFAMDGRLMLEKEVLGNHVDVTNLPPGSYILKTNTPQPANFKLLKL